jgi:hypothetical protein
VCTLFVRLLIHNITKLCFIVFLHDINNITIHSIQDSIPLQIKREISKLNFTIMKEISFNQPSNDKAGCLNNII